MKLYVELIVVDVYFAHNRYLGASFRFFCPFGKVFSVGIVPNYDIKFCETKCGASIRDVLRGLDGKYSCVVAYLSWRFEYTNGS